jgi:hypothetical protein
MLAKICSDTWQSDPTSEVFINRDGERFRYVLDYLRDGSVALPLSIPKAAFLKELEYFGFEGVDAGSITVDYSSANEASNYIAECYANFKKECQARVNDLEMKINYHYLALACYKSFSDGGDLKRLRIDKDVISRTVLYAMSRNPPTLPDKERSVFDECLEPYGLRCIACLAACSNNHYYKLGKLSDAADGEEESEEEEEDASSHSED